MTAFAAVMTGQGAGAIATIQLFGDSAEAILRKIFRRASDGPFEFASGRILLGHIVDGRQTIDQVTIGCEGPHIFAVHCHGNPLIVERIMRLLRRRGVQPIAAEGLLARMLTAQEPHDAIRVEARLALTTVKTIEGARIIVHQVGAGLSEKVRQWRDRLDSMPLDEIVVEAGRIVKDSEPARLIISGCTIALIGPPNTGKSTLLNTLAGREKAIVADIPGTTRDWVSAEIHIPPLAATVIDTAGLDPAFAASGGVDQAAQQKTVEVLDRADLALLVLDHSQPADQLREPLIAKLVGRRVVIVLNKSDLPPRFDPDHLPRSLGETVRISAKTGAGIDDLIQAIHRTGNVSDFNLRATVAFTDRQKRLLEALQQSGSKANARSILAELLESTTAFPMS